MTTDYTAGAPLPDYAVYEVDKFGTLLEVDVAAVAGAAMVVDTPPQPTASPVLQQSVYVQNNDVRLADAAGTAAPSVVTKVIIAKTTAPTPVRLAPSGITLAHSAPREFCVLNRPGARLTRTPTKLVTAAGGGVLSPTRVLPATPPRQLAVSPLRTPTKITMVPISLARSPQQTAGGQVLTMVAAPQGRAGTAAGTLQPSLIGLSPSKLVLKAPHTMVMQQQQQQPSGLVGVPRFVASADALTIAGSGGGVAAVQPLPVTGSKFQYVRLVTTSGGGPVQQGTKPMSIAPATIAPAKSMMLSAPAPLKIALSGASTHQVLKPPAAGHVVLQAVGQQQQPALQRLILPATGVLGRGPLTTSLAHIRPTPSPQSVAPAALSQLPPGTAIISSGGQTMPGFAFVPAQYVAQLQQQLSQAPPQTMPARHETNFVPITTTNAAVLGPRQCVNGSSAVSEPAGHRPRKPCNCTKSQCLKLYCDCFANGEFCSNCNCANCANNLEHEEERSRAIKSCLDRNPLAFHPKIGKGKNGEGERRHNKGCNCKRSGCLKNYCECYEAKIPCSNMCKCVGCKNFEESGDRKTLMQLADAAEVRVMQQTAAKTKLASQMNDVHARLLPPAAAANGEKLPYTFVTTDVAEAACACLLAQAEEAGRMKQMELVQERMIIEEFGRCLMQVINSANKTKEPSPVP